MIKFSLGFLTGVTSLFLAMLSFGYLEVRAPSTLNPVQPAQQETTVPDLKFRWGAGAPAEPEVKSPFKNLKVGEPVPDPAETIAPAEPD